MNGPGRTLIILGLILLAGGLLASFAPSRFYTWLGRLPGDITFRHGNFSFYFPLTTCLLVSAILSFVIWLFRK